MRRHGFALVELLIALVVLAVVGGAIHQGLSRQQRLFRSMALLLATRGDVRDAAEILSSDLSSVSMSDTLGLAADSAIEFLSVTGSSALAADAASSSILIPADDAAGLSLTSFISAPDTGDFALVFKKDSSGGESWLRRRITSVSGVSGGLSIALDYGAAPAIAGTPVRFLRRARYSLYQSSSREWYLGYRRCHAAGSHACGTIQPVSGPYAAYVAGAGGLRLDYFDAGGSRLEDPLARPLAARVEVRFRADIDGIVELGRPDGPRSDSSATSVAFRLHR